MSRRAYRAALAAWLCAAGVAEVQAQSAPLPRVFFSAAERAAITAQRHSGKPFEVQAPAVSPREPSPPPLPADAAPPLPAALTARARRIDGITVGRDTRPVAWIGGERVVDGAAWGAYRIRVERDGVRLVAGDGSVRRLRVGMELPP